MKQTRQEIREDWFVSAVTEGWRRYGGHWLTVLVGLAVVMAAIVAVGIVRHYQRQAEDAAWSQVAVADGVDGTMEAAAAAAGLAALDEKMAGRDAEPIRLLRLGDRLLEKRDKASVEEALTVYADMIARFPTHYFADRARLSLAKAHVELGDYAAALKPLDDALTSVSQPGSPMAALRAEAAWYQGLCLEHTGEAKKALDSYENALRLAEDSDIHWTQLARYSIGSLNRKLMEEGKVGD